MPDINTTGTGAWGGLSATTNNQAVYFRVVLVSPPGGTGTFNNPRLTFTIETNYTGHIGFGEASATYWAVEVASDPSFAAVVYSTTLTRDPGPITPPQTENVDATGVTTNLQVYYWRVRGYTTSVPSAVWTSSTFTVDNRVGDAALYIDANVGQNHVPSKDGAAWVDLHPGIHDSPDPNGYYSLNINVGPQFPITVDGQAVIWEADVNTDTPTPFIWWIDPDTASPGEGVKVYGFGFGDLQATYDGTLQISIDGEDVEAGILSWQTYPPSADAYTATRTIDRDTEEVDPQHTVIEFTVPDTAHEPGHMLHVETDGP